jgi:hypothetical protein
MRARARATHAARAVAGRHVTHYDGGLRRAATPR